MNVTVRTIICASLALGSVPAAAQQTMSSDSVVRVTLADAVRVAAQQNAAVESARSRIDAARARVTQRRADLLPTVTGVASERGSTINSATFPIEFPSTPGQPALFDRNGSILGPVNVFDARARVAQTLYDPAARTRIESAKTGVLAATADASNVSDLVSVSAANAYLAVLRADALYAARVADSALAAELLGIAQDQLKAGTGVALDVTRARSQLTGVRTQVISARNDRERTRIELARAMGLPPVKLEVVDALAQLPVQAATTAIGAGSRRDVEALNLQAQSARQQANAIKLERLPTVGVFADQGFSQRNGRSILPTYEFGLQLSYPIFEGFRREGRYEEQASVARDYEARARDLRTQADADVATATLNLRSSAEVVSAARERLALAEQEVSQARERFQAGVAGNADVITASLTLNTARTQLVDALTTYQASRVALARAQGSITTLYQR